MSFGIRARIYKDLLEAFRGGGHGEAGKLAYAQTVKGRGADSQREGVKNLLRAMSDKKVEAYAGMEVIRPDIANYTLARPFRGNIEASGTYDKKVSGYFNPKNQRINITPSVFKEPSVLSHELRHAYQYKNRNSSDYFPVGVVTNPEQLRYYGNKLGSIPGSPHMWKIAYRGHPGGDAIPGYEVDAILSSHANELLAKLAGDSSPDSWKRGDFSTAFRGSKSLNLTQLWESLSDEMKEYYIKTAAFGGATAGLGFQSEPFLQGESVARPRD